jgi:hypothetical protein
VEPFIKKQKQYLSLDNDWRNPKGRCHIECPDVDTTSVLNHTAVWHEDLNLLEVKSGIRIE